MSETFEKLKAILTEKQALDNTEVEKMVVEHGEMTDDEKMWLESERHSLERASGETITMDQYLEACKVLDSTDEGAEAYKEAEAIVEKYEAGN